MATSIVEEVVSGSDAEAFFRVGLNGDGDVCAKSGYEFQAQTICGGGDTAASVFQGEQSVALAGYAPSEAAIITAVFNRRVARWPLSW